MDKFGVFIVNQNSNQIWDLSFEQKNIIGRGLSEEPGTTILIPNPTVSKIHAYIYLDPQEHRWYFENKSKNGSKVNGQRVLEKFPLIHGDQITIGPNILIFYERFRADEGTVEISILDRVGEDFFSQQAEMSSEEEVGLIVFLVLIVLFICLFFSRF